MTLCDIYEEQRLKKEQEQTLLQTFEIRVVDFKKMRFLFSQEAKRFIANNPNPNDYTIDKLIGFTKKGAPIYENDIVRLNSSKQSFVAKSSYKYSEKELKNLIILGNTHQDRFTLF